MGAVAFDTLKFVERLETGGFSHTQAKAAAEAFAEATAQELATKSDLALVQTKLSADIASVRADLGAEIASVRADLRADIAALRSQTRSDIEIAKRDLKIWMGSGLVAAVTILLAAIRYLPPAR